MKSTLMSLLLLSISLQAVRGNAPQQPMLSPMPPMPPITMPMAPDASAPASSALGAPIAQPLAQPQAIPGVLPDGAAVPQLPQVPVSIQPPVAPPAPVQQLQLPQGQLPVPGQSLPNQQVQPPVNQSLPGNTSESSFDQTAARAKTTTVIESYKESVSGVVDVVSRIKSDLQKRYLDLDTKLDALWQELGMSRGETTERVDQLAAALLTQALTTNNTNISDTHQETVARIRKDIDTLTQRSQALITQEQAVHQVVSQIYAKIDAEVLDQVLRLAEIAKSVRETEGGDEAFYRDQEAKARVIKEQVDKSRGEIERMQQDDLQKAYSAIESLMGEVTTVSVALKSQGIVLTKEIDAVEREQREQVDEHVYDAREKEFPAAQKKTLREKKNRANRDSQELKNITPRSSKKGGPETLLESIQNGGAVVVDALAYCAREAWRVITVIFHVVTERTNIFFLDTEPYKDPELEKIRLERNDGYEAFRTLLKTEKELKIKEELLSSRELKRRTYLESQGVTQERQNHLYSTLSWQQLLQHIFWKAYNGVSQVISALV